MNFIQVPNNRFFCFFSFSSFTIDFKICLYARHFDTSHCPPDIFWLHFASSPKLWENNLSAENLNEVQSSFRHKLFSQSFEELAKCSQNMSGGQCDVSKRLVYRHILKSIVRELKEKRQKFHFPKLELTFKKLSMQFAALIPHEEDTGNREHP